MVQRERDKKGSRLNNKQDKKTRSETNALGSRDRKGTKKTKSPSPDIKTWTTRKCFWSRAHKHHHLQSRESKQSPPRLAEQRRVFSATTSPRPWDSHSAIRGWFVTSNQVLWRITQGRPTQAHSCRDRLTALWPGVHAIDNKCTTSASSYCWSALLHDAINYTCIAKKKKKPSLYDVHSGKSFSTWDNFIPHILVVMITPQSLSISIETAGNLNPMWFDSRIPAVWLRTILDLLAFPHFMTWTNGHSFMSKKIVKISAYKVNIIWWCAHDESVAWCHDANFRWRRKHSHITVA